jgi:hypothetical protein
MTILGSLRASVIGLAFVTQAVSLDFYVSPAGTPTGNGTQAAPWDLATALAHPPVVRPGDTIWLRGGTYRGPFASSLTGTASAPIRVRAYPGEAVRLDDSMHTRLVTALPSAGDAPCTLEDGTIFADGSWTQIDSEQIYLEKISGNNYRCLRGLNGTPVSAHAAGAKVLKLGPVLRSTGSYVWWWGFEITSVRSERNVSTYYRGPGLDMTNTAKGNKAINLIIHNTGHPGIGFWNQRDGGEIYGCLIWGVGNYDPSFGNGDLMASRRGSAIYAQNDAGTVRVHDTIMFRNLTNGLNLYSENGATDGFDVRRNVVFDNSTGELFSSGGGSSPQRGLKVIDNFTWARSTASANTARMGYNQQNDMEFRDNYIVGGASGALMVNHWTSSVAVTGNTIVGPYLTSLVPNGALITWNQNRYYSTGSEPFVLNDSRSYTFSGWKSATGLDASSTFASTAAPPDAIYVRANQYEPGRGHVVVYNWSKKPSVQIDLSGVVSPGSSFEIRDAQNILAAPLVSGTYTGTPVAVPMNITSVAPITGYVPTIKNVHTSPVFAVFVVTGTGTSTSNSAPVVSAGADQTIVFPAAATLSATATDDGRPNPTLTTYWSKVSGPGTVTFGSAASRSTTASFSTAGTYVLGFTASDGSLSASDNVTVNVTAPATDTARPVISGVSAVSITMTGATIKWTTNEASDTQVEYGVTTAYGSITPLNTQKVTSHSVALSGLRSNTLYSYRVRSRDAAGNLAVSGNFTFRTASSSTVLTYEAESGTLISPMTKITPSGSGVTYVYTPTVMGGVVRIVVSVPTTANYVIWARVLSPTYLSDSFFVSVDNGPEDVFDTAEGKWSPAWQWTVVNGRGTTNVPLAINPRVFQLSAGTHVITFRGREANAGLDSIIVTSDLSYTPAQ